MLLPKIRAKKPFMAQCDDDYDCEPCPRPGIGLGGQILVATIGSAAGALVEQIGSGIREYLAHKQLRILSEATCCDESAEAAEPEEKAAGDE